MKKTKITILATIILVFCTGLFARAAEGRFKLKEGDWFEYLISNESTDLSNYQLFDLKFTLTSVGKNGNQKYQLTLNREKRIISSFNGDSKTKVLFGYDSYYPPFSENGRPRPVEKIFWIEVSPVGSIISFSSQKQNAAFKLELRQISLKKRYNYSASYVIDSGDSLSIIGFCETIFKANTTEVANSNKLTTEDKLRSGTGLLFAKQVDPISKITRIPIIENNGLPLVLSSKKNNYILSNASFPIPGNTIVCGKIYNRSINTVKIEDKEFPVNNDGTFNCPILVSEPLETDVLIGATRVHVFLEPLDTLNISLNKDSSSETISYSGSASENTKLLEAFDKLIPQVWQRDFDKDIQSFLTYHNKQSILMKDLLKKYQDKVSPHCFDYLTNEVRYYLAQSKFEFCENHIFGNFSQTPFSIATDCPSDFFQESDTLAVLMNRYEHGTYFNQFLTKSTFNKQLRISMSLGTKDLDDFPVKYAVIRSSLDGYPLYSQLFDLLYSRLKNDGYNQIKPILAYYEDFIHHCSNPEMTETLKKLHQKSLLYAPEKKFPLELLETNNHTKYLFGENKGKVVCLYFCSRVSMLKRFSEEINKFQTENIEFVFVVAQNQFNLKALENNPILSAPKTKIIFVNEESISSLLPIGGLGRILILDRWLRIVEDNAENPELYGDPENFEKAIKKAIEAKRYSKAEKTAFFKTAGWSFGSILFTFLIGLWVYKVRVRRIKRQEATKRRMKELEIKAIRSQMNPHFIFNALNSIQSLINENQFKQANIYLSKFALLLREVLNNSEKAMVTLSDELKAVELYCQLEQLRFEFQFAISISPEINSQLIEIPGMIIQPLAENAVVHGLLPKGSEGRLTIEISKQNDDLCICVSDNGSGLTDPKEDRLGQKGFGLKLIEERIKVLNIEGKSARLTLQNRADNQGAMATLIIPID